MKRTILFVGGGTAGHIAPVLSVIEAVQRRAKDQKQEVVCVYAGLKSDLDSPLIQASKLSFKKVVIHAGKLHRHFTFDQFKQAGSFLKGIAEAKKLIKTYEPDVVFAKGGYSTVPLVWAASRQKIPVFCHESDAVPGLANRIISRLVTGMFTTYPVSSYEKLSQKRLMETGQPVREMFYERATNLPKELKGGVTLVTVIGGSQGARRVNALVGGLWEKLAVEAQLVHITGEAEYQDYEKKLKALPGSVQERIHLKPFVKEELPALFQLSAIVISRSGGIVAELAASRACTILIPLSTAAQNHQWANAKVLEAAGAAVTFDERNGTSEQLYALVKRLLKDTQESTQLRAAIGRFDHPHAADTMAKVLLDPSAFL